MLLLKAKRLLRLLQFHTVLKKKMCVPMKNFKPGTLKGRFKTTGYCSNDGSAAFE